MRFLISRKEFDIFLPEKAKEAGIEVPTKEKVLCCEEMPTYVEVKNKKTVYNAKFALVAERIQSVVKKCLKPADQGEYELCVVAEVAAKKNKIEECLRNNLELYFGISGDGYGWIFPHKTYYSVGIGGVIKDFSHPKEFMLDFLRRNVFFGKYEIHGHQIPRGGVERRINGSKVLLVGCAAGFVDAFSCDGLPYAIISGHFASEIIAGICLCCGNLKDLDIYKSLCQAECWTHLKYSLIFSEIMHRVPDLIFKLFTSIEMMANKYFEFINFSLTYIYNPHFCLLKFRLM